MTVAAPPEILRLLGDPLRWSVLVELGRSDRRAGELVALVGKPQNLVSYHLGELRRAGVVTARRSSADRRDVYYRAHVLRCREMLNLAGLSLHPAAAGDHRESASPARARRRRARPRVLFLCTGNSARSQIAEALAQHRSNGMVWARSAGSHPKALHPWAVRVLAERGIDISDRAAKPLSRFAGSRFDRVITLCDKVREICPDFPGHPASAHWSMADPAAAGGEDAVTDAFRHTADEIEERVALLLAELDASPSERRHPHA